MKRLLIIFIILVAGFLLYWFKFRSSAANDGPKQQPLTVKKHSLEFNTSVVKAMNAYFDMKNAFVDADTVKAKNACRNFITLLDSIHLDELKKDTASIFETAQANLNDVKANAASLLQQTDITEMRQDFRMVSEMLYPSFFNSINYEGPKMYWQSCPMAFGEGKEGNWISNTVEVINPFLGKNDPKFSAEMQHCGEVKDTIKTK